MSDGTVNTETNEILQAAEEIANPEGGFLSREDLNQAQEVLADLLAEVEEKELLEEDELNHLRSLCQLLTDMDVNWDVPIMTDEEWEQMLDDSDEEDEEDDEYDLDEE